MWNVSTLGVYLVLAPPLPELGEELRVRFALTGGTSPLVAQCRVAWQNPALSHGVGHRAATLPPGCGLEFLAIGADDRERIAARVRATHPGRTAEPKVVDALGRSEASRIEAAVQRAAASLAVRDWEFTVSDQLQHGRVMIEIRTPNGSLAYTSVGLDDEAEAIAQRLRMFVGK